MHTHEADAVAFGTAFNDSSGSNSDADEFDRTSAYLGLHGLVHPARGSHKTASVQSDQHEEVANTILHYPPNGEAADSTSATSVQSDQYDAVADAILLESNNKVGESFDTAAGQYGRTSAVSDVNLQDPFTRNSKIRGSDQEEANAFSGVCYPSEYAASVKQLSTMLYELEKTFVIRLASTPPRTAS